MHSSKKSIGILLGVGFGIVLLLLVLTGVLGYWSTSSISAMAIKEFKEMLRTDAAIAEHSARARSNVLGLRRFEKDMFLNIGSKEKEEDYLKKWKEQKEHLLNRLNDLQKAAVAEQDKNTVAEMRNQLTGYESGFLKIYSMIQSGNLKTPQEGNAAINEYKDSTHKLEEAAKRFSEDGNKRMVSIENEIIAKSGSIKTFMVILCMVFILVGTGIAVLIGRWIIRPLKRIIDGLTEASNQVACAAEEVSAASQSLAEGSSQQAASVEETSSSLEEISSMTKQNASNSGQADSLMKQANQVVIKANASMDQLTTSMQEISKASEETSKIIKPLMKLRSKPIFWLLTPPWKPPEPVKLGQGLLLWLMRFGIWLCEPQMPPKTLRS
jgi:methyl-accepting chemotaxis protein